MKKLKIEKDWITKAGYRAIVNVSTHRCGYVGVPPGHPLHGKSYMKEADCLQPLAKRLEGESLGKRSPILLLQLIGRDDIPPTPEVCFNVHGGITFSTSNIRDEYPAGRRNDLWWFGYDCAHSGDETDYLRMPGSVRRSLEYCVAECESLAKQLKEVEELSK